MCEQHNNARSVYINDILLAERRLLDAEFRPQVPNLKGLKYADTEVKGYAEAIERAVQEQDSAAANAAWLKGYGDYQTRHEQEARDAAAAAKGVMLPTAETETAAVMLPTAERESAQTVLPAAEREAATVMLPTAEAEDAQTVLPTAEAEAQAAEREKTRAYLQNGFELEGAQGIAFEKMWETMAATPDYAGAISRAEAEGAWSRGAERRAQRQNSAPVAAQTGAQEQTGAPAATTPAQTKSAPVGARTLTGGGLNGGENILRGGQERNDGASAGEQNGGVDKGTGGGAAAVDGVRTPARGANGRETAGRRELVSAASLGISGGATNSAIHVKDRSEYSEQERELSSFAESHGLELVLVEGAIRVTGKWGTTSIGGIVIDGAKAVVRTDMKNHSTEQLVRHEVFHKVLSETAGLRSRALELLRESYGADEINALPARYMEAYKGCYGELGEDMDGDAAEALMEVYMDEALCDAYAGMNRSGIRASRYSEPVRQAAAEYGTDEYEEATARTTGPPEGRYSFAGNAHYSIEEIDGRIMPVIDTENDTRDYVVAEKFLRGIVGAESPFATILSDAQPVYIGKDLPGEYRGSKYTQGLSGALRKVKMQAATNLDEMLLLAENGEWRENVKDKHSVDAKNGWYWYDTEFAMPILNARKELDHYTIYGAELLVRNDADGKSYLYDLLNLTEKKKVISSSPSTGQSRSGVFEPKPSQGDGSTGESESQVPVSVKQKLSPAEEIDEETEAQYEAAVQQGDMAEAGRIVKPLFDAYAETHKVSSDEAARYFARVLTEADENYESDWGIRFDARLLVPESVFPNSHQLFQDAEYDDDGELLYPEGEGFYEGFYDAGELAGTSTLGIDTWHADENEVAERIQKHLSSFYEGNYAYLVRGEKEEPGNDPGEDVLSDAQVAAVLTVAKEKPDYSQGWGRMAREFTNKSLDPVTYDDDGKVIPLRERFNDSNPDIRFSPADEDFAEAVQEWYDETDERDRTVSHGYFEIGETPNILQDIGVHEGKIYLRKHKVGYVLGKHPEITIDEVKAIPDMLADPVLIMKSLTEANSIVLFSYLSDEQERRARNGNKKARIMSALNLTPKPGGHGADAKFTLLASAYGRTGGNIQELLKNSEILYIGTDKKRADTWLMQLRVQFPSGQPAYGSTGRITYDGDVVNIQGKRLSELGGVVTGKPLFSPADEIDGETAPESGAAEDSGLDIAGLKKRLGQLKTQIDGINWVLGNELLNDVQRAEMAEQLKPMKAERARLNKELAAKQAETTAAKEIERANRREADKAERAAQRDYNAQLRKAKVAEERAARMAKHEAERPAREAAAKKRTEGAVSKATEAKSAKRDLKKELIAAFSVPVGRRKAVGNAIDEYATGLLNSGYISQSDRDGLFELLYVSGAGYAEPEQSMADIAKQLRGRRYYVPEGVKHEFSDGWNDIRKRAFACGIYFTDNKQDLAIDEAYVFLSSEFGKGLFSDTETDEAAMLEHLVDIAEQGKGESLTLDQLADRTAREEGLDAAEFREEMQRNLDRRIDNALDKFVEKAKLEVRLTAAQEKKLAEQKEALRVAQLKTKNNAEERILAGELRADERIAEAEERSAAQLAERDALYDTAVKKIGSNAKERQERTEQYYKERLAAQRERSAAQIARLRKHKQELTGVPTSVEEAIELYKQIDRAQHQLDNVQEEFNLTGAEYVYYLDLINKEINLADVDPAQADFDHVEAAYNAYREYEEMMRRVRKYHAIRHAQQMEQAAKLTENAIFYKDKALGLAYSRETMERNVLDIVRGADGKADEKGAQAIIDTYFTPVHEHAAAATRTKNEYRDRVRRLGLSTAVKHGNMVSEAHAVQLYGEAVDNLDYLTRHPNDETRDGKTTEEWSKIITDLWATSPKLDQDKIKGAVEEFRKMYNELFQMMNEARVRNGYEPVHYRKGYFPHFQQKSDGVIAQFGRALGIGTEVTELPTSINGLTHTFRPGIQWFGNTLKRLGFATTYDAVEGFDRYIEGVADVIHHTDDIQRLRAFSDQIRFRSTDEETQKRVNAIRNDRSLTPLEKREATEKEYKEAPFALSKFVVELEEYTNILANKKSRYDRDMENQLSRGLYNVSKAVSSRVGANMVAVNVSSWLTNYIPLLQGNSQLSQGAIIKGMWDTLKSYKADDGIIDKSTFLTNRYGSDPLVRTWMDSASATLSKPMEMIDHFTAGSLVRARYCQNLRRGMSETEAMREADAFTAGIMADRSKGAQPTLFSRQNFTTKVFTQFQLETNNQLSWLFKDVPREKRKRGVLSLALALTRFFLGGFIYNEIFEALFGRRPAMDALEILNDASGNIFGYELPNIVETGIALLRGEDVDFSVEQLKPGEAISEGFETALENVPFTPLLGLAGLDVDGGRLPVSNAIPDFIAIRNAITNDAGWSDKKRWKEVQDELNKLAYLLPPFGGGQVKKLYQGVQALIKGGSYSVDGEGNDVLQYPVYATNAVEKVTNAVGATLFGKTTLPTAREWIESGFKSFSAKETVAYQDMTEAGVLPQEAHQLLKDLKAAGNTGDKLDVLRSSPVDEAGQTIAYYTLIASDKERELMDALADAGEPQEKFGGLLMELRDAGTLPGAAGSNAKRNAIADSGLTDIGKKMVYRDKISASRDEDIEAFTEAGLSFDTFLKVQNEYTTINETVDGAGQKATEFSRWVNGQDFTPEHGAAVREAFKYYSQTPASGGRYDSFMDAGLSDAVSYSLASALSALEPERGKDSVSESQKLACIVGADLSQKDAVTALGTLLGTDTTTSAGNLTQYGKLKAALKAGLDLDEWLDAKNSGTLDKTLDLIGGGVDEDAAMKVAERLDRLDEDAGAIDKYLAAASLPLSPAETDRTIHSLMETAGASESAVASYDAIRKTGVTPYEYWRFKDGISGVKADVDESGKSVSGSRKNKILAAIDATGLSVEQKDALYRAEGYAESALGEAPWR